MANYGEVKNLFIGLLNNRKLTPSLVTMFLDEGFRRCQVELRCPAMERGVEVTIGSDYDGLYIPSDYLELVRLQNSYGKKLVKKSLDYVRGYDYPDIPLFYARQVKKWVLGPLPVEGDKVRIDYYSEFGALSSDTDENLLTVIAPTLPVYAGLSLAADYFSDDRAQRFEARYLQILGQLNDQADTDEVTDANVEQAFEYPDDF